MTRRRGILRARTSLTFAAALALVAGLAACAPATHVSHHTAGSGGSGNTASSATPTPTPTAVAAPASRIPLTCQQLAPTSQVDSTIGLPLIPSVGLYQASDLDPYSFTQDGAVDCSYQMANPDDLGFYEILVVPDVTTAEWTAFTPNVSDYDIKPSPFGANSYLDCTASYHDADCDLDMIVGTTVIHVNDYSPAQPTESNAAEEAHMLPLLKIAVNGVKAATIAEPAWSDPNASAVSVPSSEATVMSAVSTAVGYSVTPSISGPEQLPDPSQAQSFAEAPVKFASYAGDSTKYEYTIDVLPQGAWAWSKIVAAVSSKPGYSIITGLGDEAIGFSDKTEVAPYEAIVEATKGDNLVAVTVYTSTAGQYAAMLADAKKTAAAILSDIG